MTGQRVIAATVERLNWSTKPDRYSDNHSTYVSPDGRHTVQVGYSQRGSVTWAALEGSVLSGQGKASRVTNFLESPYDVSVTKRLTDAAKASPFMPRTALGKLGRSLAAALFATYDVGVTLIDNLDNGGEPCEHCQLIGHVIQVQAYGTTYKDHPRGERVMVESCMACLPSALVHAEVDATQSLRLEIALGEDE